MRAKKPLMADRVEQGMFWLVLASEIHAEKGALATIQAADNSTRAVGRLASDIELVRRAVSKISSGVASSAALESLKAALVGDAPHLMDGVDGYVSFAMQLGAGADGGRSAHMARLTSFCERFLTRGRRVRGEVWGAIATNISVAFPNLKIAIVWLAYSCPSSEVKQRICTWVSLADINGAACNGVVARACNRRHFKRSQNTTTCGRSLRFHSSPSSPRGAAPSLGSPKGCRGVGARMGRPRRNRCRRLGGRRARRPRLLPLQSRLLGTQEGAPLLGRKPQALRQRAHLSKPMNAARV